MTFKIAQLQVDHGNINYYSDGFRNVIENHILILRSSPGTTQLVLDGQLKNKYTGDFYGMLSEMEVPVDLHWIILRINFMHTPKDNFSEYDYIYIPIRTELDLLLSRYLSKL